MVTAHFYMGRRLVLQATMTALSVVGPVRGQDIHFSQYNEARPMVNPALTGSENHLWASLQYREQWRSVTVPYRTFNAFIETRAFKSERPQAAASKALEKRTLAAGLAFLSDKAGDGNMGLTQMHFAIAGHVPVSDLSFLSGGLSFGVAQRSVDYSKLTWPAQYNGKGYNHSISAGENFSRGRSVNADVAAGLLWSFGRSESYMTANNYFKGNLGTSIHHINRPRVSFISEDRMFMRIAIHGSLSYGLGNTNMVVAPSFMASFQGPYREVLGGAYMKFRLRDHSRYTGLVKSSYFSLGTFYRNLDAIVPAFLYESGQYAIGVSYDINVSGLVAASHSRGGLEIVMRYMGDNPFLYKQQPRL